MVVVGRTISIDCGNHGGTRGATENEAASGIRILKTATQRKRSSCIKEYARMPRAFGITLKLVLVAFVATLFVNSQSLAYEMTLGGIRLGRPAITVLQKYGDPTRIAVGTVAVAASLSREGQQTQGQQLRFDPYGLGGSMPTMSGPEGSLAPYSPFAQEYTPPSMGMLPALPGLGGSPQMTLPGAAGPETGAGGDQSVTITQQEVTWTYDLPGGVTLEVIIAEGGIITQITAAGSAKWAASKTAKGVQLGSTYKDVIFRYGYPEAHTQAGQFLRASYVDKDRCMFTFLNRKVVGITIAFND